MVGGSALGIGVTMFLRDQFSGPAARIRSAAQVTAQEMRRMQEQQLRQQRNMYAGMAFAGGMAIRRMGKVVSSAAKFGYEMEFVKQIAKTTDKEMQNLSNQAMEIGQRTIFFAKDVAEGMRFMAMAGMGYKDVAGNIAAAVDLAAAANLSIAGRGGAADIMTNIMIAFKKDAAESSYVADILAEAATSANLSVFELGEALKYSASTAMTLNISLEESTAILQTIADAGIQGSMAGVAFENSMRYLSQATGKFASGAARKALAELGLTGADFRDASGNVNSMTQNITVLKKAMTGLGTGERYDLAKALFGVRGARAGLLLINNYSRFMQHLGSFQDAQGRSAEISSGMMDTLEGQLLRFTSAWKNLGVMFTKGIEPVLRPLIYGFEILVKLIQKLVKIPILGNMLTTGFAAFIALNTVAFAFKAIVKGIRLITMQTASTTTLFQTKAVWGWKSMTAAAREYNAAVLSANMAGGMATKAGLTAMAAAGGIKGIAVNKAGRLVAASRTGMRAFVGTSAAAAVAKGTARVVGGRVVAKTGTQLILGRILGVLGGPLGLALTFILPTLIGGLVGAIKKQKEATEEGTRTLKQNMAKRTVDQRYTRMGHMIQFEDLNAPVMRIIGETGMNKLSQNWDQNQLSRLADTLEKLLENPQTQPINIYVDGEKAMERFLERNSLQYNVFQ